MTILRRNMILRKGTRTSRRIQKKTKGRARRRLTSRWSTRMKKRRKTESINPKER